MSAESVGMELVLKRESVSVPVKGRIPTIKESVGCNLFFSLCPVRIFKGSRIHIQLILRMKDNDELGGLLTHSEVGRLGLYDQEGACVCVRGDYPLTSIKPS